jgi:hypothetical protein
MAGKLNVAWESIFNKKNMGAAWGMLGKDYLSGSSKTAFRTSRVMAATIAGGAVGGAWGAISDRETVVGGAMKGAFVGGAAAGGSLLGGRRAYRAMTKLTNAKTFRANVGRGLAMLNKRPGLRNTIYGLGALGAVRGMTSGQDNPLGGAAGGALAGSLQGGAAYGAYRGIRKVIGR